MVCPTPIVTRSHPWPWPYAAAKRLFDIGFSAVILVPCLIALTTCLVILNPILNPGPLLYRPKRMGRHCEPFRLYKFRTMVPACGGKRRGPDEPLEVDRVTPLGHFLRRTRFDELPQILNVFRGEMSLIGPRPEDFPHARSFMSDIPGYRHRHWVRPGITGLAQVELGYVYGRRGATQKTRVDLTYIRQASVALDLRIFCRTLRIVCQRSGQ